MFQTEVKKKIKHVLWSVTFILFFENRAVYEIMWKNTVEVDKSQMTICRMRIACWVTKATKHTLRIPTAFPLQQRLHERASVLH